MANETKKFLDYAGTTHLWEKITQALSSKADSSDLTTLTGRVTTLEGQVYDDTALAGRVSEAESDISDLESTVGTLIGSDTGKSARTIANEELAAQLIPGNASEALDTLQEIAAWIQSHPDDASAMSAAITALQTKTELGTHSVTAYSPCGENATYVAGTTYYTDSTGSTEVDTTGFEDGVTDVSSYYIATVTTPQYATVKAYVEAMLATVADSSHSHTNKAVLDTITSALISSWNTAYTNTHTHTNKSVLDGITSELITAWNSALQASDVIALTNAEIDAAVAAANNSGSGD